MSLYVTHTHTHTLASHPSLYSDTHPNTDKTQTNYKTVYKTPVAAEQEGWPHIQISISEQGWREGREKMGKGGGKGKKRCEERGGEKRMKREEKHWHR